MRRRLAALAVALVLLPAAAVVCASRPAPRGDRSFHALTGGLGLGAAVDLSRCAAAFDPGIEPRCSLRTGPVPGGEFLCPAHAGGR
jgi:hypothetical protein